MHNIISNMISVQVLSVLLLIIYCFLKICSGNVQDDLYEKFHQIDYNLKVDREMLTFCNTTIIDFNHTFSKYNRTQFVTNVSMLFHIDVGNEVEIIVQAYKFLSNEYRAFPLHFEYNLCKALKHDVGGMQSCINACGYAACPIKKNIRYYLCNCVADESKFPPFMPNGNFKIKYEFIYKNKLFATLESYITVSRKVLPERRYLG